MNLDQATRKDWFIMLADLMMHQIVEKHFVPYLQQRRLPPSASAQLAPGIRACTALFLIIREYDWKEYGVSRGISTDLSTRKELFTMMQMFFKAQAKEWKGEPSKNTILAAKYAANHLETFRQPDFSVASVIDCYPQLKEMQTAANIIRQLEDRDEFLKHYGPGASRDEAKLYGTHPLCAIPSALVACSERYFETLDSEEDKRNLWRRLLYVLVVNAYVKSWEAAGGGITTLNVMLSQGQRGPQAPKAPFRKLWVYEQPTNDDEREVRARHDCTHVLTEVQRLVIQEILQFPDIQTYIKIVKTSRNENGDETLSPKVMRNLMAGFSERALRPLKKPVLLESAETLRRAADQLRALFNTFVKTKQAKEADLDWCIHNLITSKPPNRIP